MNILTILRFRFFLLSIFLFTSGIGLGNQPIDLDEFDDLELKPLERQRNQPTKSNGSAQQLILFDDNLYLLDDDFDFGEDEFELQKLELNPNDLETAKEYEAFLNAFFDNAVPVGSSLSPPSYSNNYQQQETRSRKDSFSDNRSRSNKQENNKVKPSRKGSGVNIPAPSMPTLRPKGGNLGMAVSAIVGASIPVGQNITGGYGAGSNLGFRLDTPVSFNIAGMEAGAGLEVYFSSFSAKASSGNNYRLTNIVSNVSVFPTDVIELKTGIGITPATIGDLSAISLSIPVDLNYYLPMDLSGYNIALNVHAQYTMGFPNDGSTDSGAGATTEFLNIGLLINTPFVF